MLWAALNLPALPVEIFTRASPSVSALVVVDGGNRPRVVAADPVALACGVRIGMLLSAVYPLAPSVIVRDRDAAAEQAALERLALWSEQFTPASSIAPPAALLLEIGGSLRYFGGLVSLLARLREGVAELGYRAAIGVAPTPTGALLLARGQSRRPTLDEASLRTALSRLPLAVLDCSTATIDALAAMGVHSLGDALRLPRAGLARRLGTAIVEEIDRALGRTPDPRQPFIAPACYAGRLELPAPAADVEQLAFGVKRLVVELAGWLLGRGLGVVRMRLDLAHERRRDTPSTTPVTMRLSAPSRCPEHLLSVWRERLSRLELVERVEAIALVTEETAPLASRNLGLLPGDEAGNGETSSLADRLRARLGDEAMVVIAPYPDHRPERAWRRSAPGSHSPSSSPSPPSQPSQSPSSPSFPRAPTTDRGGPAGDPARLARSAPRPRRPTWLLVEAQPLVEPFTGPDAWCLIDGPERIESGWWKGEDVRRDYFVARSPRGETCWIYCDARDGRWFVHGLFG